MFDDFERAIAAATANGKSDEAAELWFERLLVYEGGDEGLRQSPAGQKPFSEGQKGTQEELW